MGYVENLFAINESVRNGTFRYPYQLEEVRPLSNLPSLLSKYDSPEDTEVRLFAADLLTSENLDEQHVLAKAENRGQAWRESSPQANHASKDPQETSDEINHRTDSGAISSFALDEGTRMFFEKARRAEVGSIEAADAIESPRHDAMSVIFVHFPTEFSLRLFERFTTEIRSLSVSSQNKPSSSCQAGFTDKPLSDRFNDKSMAAFASISSAVKGDKCKILRFDHLKSESSEERISSMPETLIVLFLDDERIQGEIKASRPVSWEDMHESARGRLQLLYGKKKPIDKPTVYKALYSPSRESRDVFIRAQLHSLGVDLSAPVSDEMTQINEALSLLSRDDRANRWAPRLLDDQFISFIVFEIAKNHRRIDSLEKMVELLSEYDALGWSLLSNALTWLNDVKPRTVMRKATRVPSKNKKILPFRAEDCAGIDVANGVRERMASDASLCASLFFESELEPEGARTVGLRETSLLAYAIARWIVKESSYKYLKDKTACLDTFVRLLGSAGFSKEFIGSLVACLGDCLREASNRQSVVRLNLECLYKIVNQHVSSPLNNSDVVALTLRTDCDASNFREGSCWQNFFMENAPSESHATAVSNANRFGQTRLGNIKALSSFADDILDRARRKVYCAPEGELEEALGEFERAVWLQVVAKDSLGFSGVTDDVTFLAMLECAVWVDAENIRTSFQCERGELLSPDVVDRLVSVLARPSVDAAAYYFGSLALWYYSGLLSGRFISRSELKGIILSACEVLVGSHGQAEKTAAVRVLSTVPLDAFSQFVPCGDMLEKPTIDVLLRHLEEDSNCTACCLLVLARTGSAPFESARFIEMALRNLSVGGHFGNMIVSALMFETQLRAKYSVALGLYSDGRLGSSGYNDVAYIADHGLVPAQAHLRPESEKILISLIENEPTLFPTVNLFLHYLQNEEDPDKAFGFYREAVKALNPTESDLSSASAWWGKMAAFGHPEGLLVSLLLEASGWQIRRHDAGVRKMEAGLISTDGLKRIVGKELRGDKGRFFKAASTEEAVRRYYGNVVVDGINSLIPHAHI